MEFVHLQERLGIRVDFLTVKVLLAEKLPVDPVIPWLSF